MMLIAPHNDRIRQLLRKDRMEDIQVIEHFIIRQQETGLVSSRLNPRALAVACDAMVNGLLLDMVAGMDKDEAKKIWLIAVEALIRVDE